MTDSYFTVSRMLNLAQTKSVTDTTFRIDEIVKFSNPALYMLSEFDRTNFITAFVIVVACFFAMMGLLVLMGDFFFQMMKESASNQLSESVKFMMKSLSAIVFLMITAF